MRRIHRKTVILLLMAATLALFTIVDRAPAGECKAPALISSTGIGPVRFGVDRGELSKVFGSSLSTTTVEREGAVDAIEVRLCENVSVLAEFEGGSKASALRTHSPYFRTELGARVGDMLSRIVETHPETEINFGTTEGPYLSAFIPSLGGFFSFDVTEEVVESLDRNHLDLRTIGKLKAHIYVATKP